jgi:hypothetical protein
MVRVFVISIAVGAGLLFSSPSAVALEAVPLPMTAPPGAPVEVNVSDCPTGTTDSAAIRFRAAGGAAPAFDPSEEGLTVEQISGGGGTIDFLVPTSTTPGNYVFDVFCVSEGGGVTDGPETVPITIAVNRVTVSPGSGPAGTQVTASGSGCPTGTTDQVFIRVRGASDDVPPFDAAEPNQFHGLPNPDGSYSVSFAIPANAPLGENAVESFCISEGGSVLAGPGFGVFVVEQAEHPRTGRATRGAMVVAISCIVLGFAMSRARKFSNA